MERCTQYLLVVLLGVSIVAFVFDWASVPKSNYLRAERLTSIKIRQFNVSEKSGKRRTDLQIKQLLKMGCKPRRVKVPVRDYLVDNNFLKDKELFPSVLSVKLCQDVPSYCGNGIGGVRGKCQVKEGAQISRRFFVFHFNANQQRVYTSLETTVHTNCTCS